MRIFDKAEAEELNAAQWQIDLLNMNPGYVHWGPHEEYMCGEGSGWNSPVIKETWNMWTLDDLNECVNFYFSVNRASEECPICGGNGYHPDAQEVVNSFYAHMNPRGDHWNDKITQDELDALVEVGRIKAGATVEEINEQNKPRSQGLGHDGINRLILVRTRLERLGIPVHCPECSGNGYVFTAPSAHVTLTLWMLHPRKGCSRGVEISLVEQENLPEIFAWLREAAERNAQRFSNVPR